MSRCCEHAHASKNSSRSRSRSRRRRRSSRKSAYLSVCTSDSRISYCGTDCVACVSGEDCPKNPNDSTPAPSAWASAAGSFMLFCYASANGHAGPGSQLPL